MSNPGHTIPNEGAIYHEVSPTKIFALRIFNGFVAFFVGLSFLICLIQGQVKTVHSSADYILATNIIISSLVAGTVSWWYRTGDLGVEKYWFVVLVGCVIIFQCLTTDIYVFHKQVTIQPTPIPYFTTTATTNG